MSDHHTHHICSGDTYQVLGALSTKLLLAVKSCASASPVLIVHIPLHKSPEKWGPELMIARERIVLLGSECRTPSAHSKRGYLLKVDLLLFMLLMAFAFK